MKMSMAPRLAKSKFLIVLGLLIFLTVSFFVLSKNQNIKDQELSRISNRMEMQSRELQDIMERKLHVEKSLNHERSLNKDLNQKLQEQKEIHNKAIMDANLRFESQKQQYKLIKSQYEDLQESSTKEKKQQSEEIDGLKRKVKLLESQLDKLQKGVDSDLELYKVKYENAEKEKERLQKQLNEKCKTSSDNNNNNNNDAVPVAGEGVLAKPKDMKSFDEQQPMVPKQIVVDNINVLQQPNIGKTSSTTTSTALKISSKSNSQVVPLVPAMTPVNKNAIKGSTKANSSKLKSRPVPEGVVWPIPETNQLDDREDLENEENLAKEAQDLKIDLKDQDQKFLDNLKNPPLPNDVNELENGAHEINDNNDFNIDKDHDLLHEHDDKNLMNNIINNNNNNAAEEDTYDNLGHKNKKNEKLLNEIVGDHGKEGGYPDEMEDLHLDGNANEAEEDGGDVGEYDDPKALKQGIAVRN